MSGTYDLADGLSTAASLFEADTNTDPATVQTLQIVTLVVVVALCVAFMLKYFFPWLDATLKESRQVAEMLSLLPPEVAIIDILEGRLK